ncbi:hypothetical protein EDB85DRAFT_1896200 [Lactarius pseudohatsudake]|nr:hypothetical protein EDB85DRAFT_1896200 [Lactarius pseudohatsudake]
MWGHSTYLDDDGLHVRVSQTRTRRRNRLRYEAALAVARRRTTSCSAATALAHGEPVDLGLPEADIDDDDQVPGSGWRRALIDEPYPMDIPLVGGGRGHARYLRFTLDAEGRPTVLGSEGAGRPAYSSGLYARPQPREQHTPDDDSLALYDSHHASRHDIDLALARLGDPGVCAEVLRYRGSARRKEQLLGQMRDLERRWTDWVGRARGVDRRLKEANVPSRTRGVPARPTPQPPLTRRTKLRTQPRHSHHGTRRYRRRSVDRPVARATNPRTRTTAATRTTKRSRTTAPRRGRASLSTPPVRLLRIRGAPVVRVSPAPRNEPPRALSQSPRTSHTATVTPFALPRTVVVSPPQHDPCPHREAPRARRATPGIRPLLPHSVVRQRLDLAPRPHPTSTTTASIGAAIAAISTDIVRDERGKKGAYVTIT